MLLKQYARACRRVAATAFVTFILGACSSASIEDYDGLSPKLDVFEFFQGDLLASGVVKNRSGKVVRHFNADIKAFVEGEELILDETFLFNDGEEDFRKWRIKRTGVDVYEGVANDVSGLAFGQAAGNALRWEYKLNLVTNGRTIEVDFDDWMFQTSDNIIINISDIKKWGFKVGEVVLVIIKKD